MHSDMITQQTYNGDGQAISMTAVQPLSGSTPNQQTKYVYGVGSSGHVYSNTLLYAVEYPDKTTGVASTSCSNDLIYAYDFVGEKTSFTDPNGDVHGYTLSILDSPVASASPGFEAQARRDDEATQDVRVVEEEQRSMGLKSGRPAGLRSNGSLAASSLLNGSLGLTRFVALPCVRPI